MDTEAVIRTFFGWLYEDGIDLDILDTIYEATRSTPREDATAFREWYREHVASDDD